MMFLNTFLSTGSVAAARPPKLMKTEELFGVFAQTIEKRWFFDVFFALCLAGWWALAAVWLAGWPAAGRQPVAGRLSWLAF